MEFVRLSTGELIVRGHETMPSEIRAALPGFLGTEQIMDAWQADSVSPAATFDRAWYSPTAGFMHQCAHAPEDAVLGCADSEPVTVVHL